MTTHAYDELYLDNARSTLGHAFDYALNTLCIPVPVFEDVLAVSPVSRQFAEGNPKYTVGMNGCELAKEILTSVHIAVPEAEDVMYVDRSPEYWAGWILAFYQWYTDHTFADIFRAAPLSKVLDMYPLYHEMDVMQSADALDQCMKTAFPTKRLRMQRNRCGLSQSQLSESSGVPLRQIQLFEQGQRDINRTSADTLYRLSKALHCRMENLLEKDGHQ